MQPPEQKVTFNSGKSKYEWDFVSKMLPVEVGLPNAVWIVSAFILGGDLQTPLRNSARSSMHMKGNA